MGLIRQLGKKGEMYKVRVVASQVAHYRQLSDKNFERDAMIGTRAQLMKSNHKINKAEVEAIKVRLFKLIFS